jgi:hypothetical protein
MNSSAAEGVRLRGEIVMAKRHESYLDSLCALLAGAECDWPHGQDDIAIGAISRLAEYHGVVALLYHALRQPGCINHWPRDLVQRWRSQAMRAAAQEAIRFQELSRVLHALDGAGIRPLLVKGTALAYSLYAEPALRHRADTDILIGAAERKSLAEVLRGLDYQRCNGVTGELVSSQSTFIKTDHWAISHTLDVHWRVSNFQIFGNRLANAELQRSAIAIDGLGSLARTIKPAHALLLACMHRLGHLQAPYYVDGVARFDSDRLIWLYDIHLLAESFGQAQWRDFSQIAVAKQLQLVSLDGLAAARRRFATAIPAAVEQSLFRATPVPAVPVRRFQAPRWRWEISELMALPTWLQRCQLVKEHLLPAPAYLSAKYGPKAASWLPLFYLRRALAGVWKRL